MSPMPEHLLDQVSELCETVYSTGEYAAKQKCRMLQEQVRELTEKLVELRRESSERLDRIQVLEYAEPTVRELPMILILRDRCRGMGPPERALSEWLDRLQQSRDHRP